MSNRVHCEAVPGGVEGQPGARLQPRFTDDAVAWSTRSPRGPYCTHVQRPPHVERRRGLAAHGPADQPHGHHVGDVVRRAARLGRGARDRRQTAGRGLSDLPSAAQGEPGADARSDLGGRPELRPRPAPASHGAAPAERRGRAAGAGRRPDGAAARSIARACTTASPTAWRWRECCSR
jgi:hypothetical protein